MTILPPSHIQNSEPRTGPGFSTAQSTGVARNCQFIKCPAAYVLSRLHSAEQSVQVAGRRFHFAEGELIHTENSYKYAIPEFQTLAARAGFRTVHTWTDRADLFSVHYLRRG